MKISKTFWIFSSVILGLVPGLALAQRQLIATHEDVPALIPPGGQIPRWTNNRLAGCNPCSGAPILYTADRRSNRETVALDVPGSDLTAVYDVAAGPDGSIAAVGMAMSGDSRMGTFIAWIAPDRSRQVITRVWPYGALVVTVAPDGTIWTVGPVMNENYREVYPNVLRHYAPSGQLLASTLIGRARKSNFGMYKVSETSKLMASSDRIGWLTMTCQYIEFSFDAVELGRYACPNGYSDIQQVGYGAALSSANDLLVGEGSAVAPLAPLELDRATNTWKPVPVLQDSGKTIGLMGFDGLTLVTEAAGPMLRRYVLSNQPLAGGQ
jgi:hypothetical protein